MLLVADKVNKTYTKQGKIIYANKNISFQLNKGEILGILGPNGAGKTTLIKQIVNLLMPDSGKIIYKGEDIIKNPRILMGSISIALLKDMGLYDFRNMYSFEYSSGMNKKLSIATCLINEPEVVILDEPTSGLDVVAVEDLINFIKEISNLGKTFIIVSHDMRFIEKVTRRVIYIKDGEICLDGDTSQIKNYRGVKEVIVSTENTEGLVEFLRNNSIDFQSKGNVIVIKLNIMENKELFLNIISNYNILNVEKSESDFEKLFKEILKK
jgi:ABC-2 type transport system ATP-binding protein/sodium transport system ATP-binding protein